MQNRVPNRVRARWAIDSDGFHVAMAERLAALTGVLRSGSAGPPVLVGRWSRVLDLMRPAPDPRAAVQPPCGA